MRIIKDNQLDPYEQVFPQIERMSSRAIGVRAADYFHKIIGWSLIGFTVFGSANLISAFDFKLRRNRKAQMLLEEVTVG